MKSMLRAVIAGVGLVALVTSPLLAKEQPPEPTRMKKLQFPDFKEFTTKNGIEALVVEHHEQPVVSIFFAIKAGDALDPEGMESLAGFTVDQLNKGTKSRSALELAEWIESVGGNVSASSQNDVSVVSITLLSDYIDRAWDYLADVVLNPTFPEDELELLRKRIKTSLELQLSNPDAMADRHFTELVYGDHPYGKQATVESVEAVTREDVLAFYTKNYVPNNVLVGVVGDVKWKDVRKALDNRFGNWQEGAPNTVSFEGAPEAPETKIYLYNKPGAVQTEIRIGHLAPEADNPDWPAITVANRILGGGADARLFMILREEKGWTYGAYSSFSPAKDRGVFRAYTQVRTEVTDSALVELMHQLERIRTEPVSKEDLKNAQDYLIGNFPIQIETPSQIARRVARNKLLGFDRKHLETYRDRLAAVSVEDVSRVMKTYMDPTRAYVVLVGDANEIMDKVGAVADVALHDIAGEPMDAAAMAVTGVDYEYDTASLGNMTATYSLTYQTMELGDLNVSLARKGDVIEVTSTMEGMIKIDEKLHMRHENLAPISYRQEMVTPGGPIGMEYDFTDTAGSGVVRMPNLPEPKEVTFEMVNGTIMDSAVDLAISCLPLEVNGSYKFPCVDSQSGSLVTVKATVMETASLETPAGTYDVYKVKLSRPDGDQYYYFGKDMPHLLVKMEMPAQGLVQILKSVVN